MRPLNDFESPNEEIEDHFRRLSQSLMDLDKDGLTMLSSWILVSLQKHRKIITLGNGGSGATASHVAGDFVKGISYMRKIRARAICLNDNIPALMAIANDISYEDIFIEQLKNFVEPDDLVIAFSGSGNSPNVVKALEFANSQDAKTVAVCGFTGGTIKSLANLSIHVNINDMEISEDAHLAIMHCVKNMVIRRLDALES